MEELESVNCMVTKQAKLVLAKYQESHKMSRQGDALDALLLEYAELVEG